MIKIKIDYESSYITNIKVTGHANYDEYGKDIVCASVSSVVITSLNAALSINDKALDVVDKHGLIDAKVLVKDDIINKILINMENMLKELSKEYSKNIKII